MIESDEVQTSWWHDLKQKGPEVRALLWMAAPVMAGQILSFSVNTITLIFVGHYDSQAMAGCALANMFCICTGYSIMFGLQTYMDSMASQAFGAGNFRLVGLLMQRGVIMVSLVRI